MKHATNTLMLALLLAFGGNAADATEPAGTVARQGGVGLTLTDVDGRISQIPPDRRAGYMDDPERIEQALRGILLEKMLAAQAETLGMADDPVVRAEIEQARATILARRRIARFLKSLPTPDMAALAQETYIANPKAYSAPDLFEIRHLLVSYRDSGVEAAKEKVATLLGKYRQEGGDFGEFVKANSDDPEAKKDGGLIKDIKLGDTEPDFEQAMLALKPGEISEPVKTKYGVHLIQLLSRTAGKRLDYEEVKATIIARLEQDYRNRERDAFFTRVRSGELEADSALVASLRTRYLPEGEGQKAIQASEQPAAGEYQRFATDSDAADRQR